MRLLLSFLPALACLAMIFMMGVLMLGRKQHGSPQASPPPSPEELANLQREIALLEAKLAGTHPAKLGSGN